MLCCHPATASGQAARRLGGSLYEHPSQPEAPPVSPSVETMSQDTWEEGTGGVLPISVLCPASHLWVHTWGIISPHVPGMVSCPCPHCGFSSDSGSVRVQLVGYGSDERRGPSVGGMWRQGRLGQLVRGGVQAERRRAPTPHPREEWHCLTDGTPGPGLTAGQASGRALASHPFLA